MTPNSKLNFNFLQMVEMYFFSTKQEELLAETVVVKLLLNSAQGTLSPIMKEFIA